MSSWGWSNEEVAKLRGLLVGIVFGIGVGLMIAGVILPAFAVLLVTVILNELVLRNPS